MKITVFTGDLQKAIANIKSSIGPAKELQFGSIGFCCTNNELTLTAQNGAVKTQAKIPCHGDDCQFSLEGKNFVAFCGRFDNDEVTLSVAEKMITVKCGGLTTRLVKTMPEADEFETASQEPMTVKKDVFKRCIEVATTCSGTNDIRPVLNGVYFDVNHGTLTTVGCDSFKLSVFKAEFDNADVSFKAIIPTIALGSILGTPAMSKDESDVTVIPYRNNKLVISCYDGEFPVHFICNLISGDYITYERMIPKVCKVKYRIDKNAFSEAIATAQITAAQTYLKFIFEGDNVRISAVSQTSQTDIDVPCDCLEGETNESPFVIGFNGVYLAKVLPVLDDLFDIEMTNPTGAAVLTADDVTVMVLPVRIKD